MLNLNCLVIVMGKILKGLSSVFKAIKRVRECQYSSSLITILLIPYIDSLNLLFLSLLKHFIISIGL